MSAAHVLEERTRGQGGGVSVDVPQEGLREVLTFAVVEGIETARRIMKDTGDIVKQEVVPGGTIRTREQLKKFVKDNAWGHHASCSCQMGPKSDPMAVVDTNFRVYGTTNLRVVDASIFPRIPGSFIVTSVYMVSEKASEVILADAPA
ncbi:MAG: GMC family oxidoreductase [Pyrinomonadaceae bacterium]|nr:GMC family oxidoreductase [Pyrinomonadaceae bacterium]